MSKIKGTRCQFQVNLTIFFTLFTLNNIQMAEASEVVKFFVVNICVLMTLKFFGWKTKWPLFCMMLSLSFFLIELEEFISLKVRTKDLRNITNELKHMHHLLEKVKHLETEALTLKYEKESLEYSIYLTKLQKDTALKYKTTHLMEPSVAKSCRMSNCFNYMRCSSGKDFKVFIYENVGDATTNQKLFKNKWDLQALVESFKSSTYRTKNPIEACLFLVIITNRNFDVSSLYKLPYWYGSGENHVLVNLDRKGSSSFTYSLPVKNTMRAIRVQTTFMKEDFRPDFDLMAMPLNHFQADELSKLPAHSPAFRKYLLYYEGPLFEYDLGNSMESIFFSNNTLLYLRTNCLIDDDSEDPLCGTEKTRKSGLSQSTFSTIVSSNGKASTQNFATRLYESLMTGSVPIIIGWSKLPYHESIDWKKCVLQTSRSNFLELLTILGNISEADVLSMRRQGRIIWEKYFSTIDIQTKTIFYVLKERITVTKGSTYDYWNRFYSPSIVGTFLPNFRMIPPHGPNDESEVFTASLLVCFNFKKAQKKVEQLSRLKCVGKILIVLNCGKSEEYNYDWIKRIRIPVKVLLSRHNSLNNKFLISHEVSTNGVLLLDEDIKINFEEIRFLFQVWRENKDRLVGVPIRTHIWNNKNWVYDPSYTCEISMVLTGYAFVHRLYLEMYEQWMPAIIRTTVDSTMNCEDIAMNFLVSHISRLPNIGTGSSWSLITDKINGSLHSRTNHFRNRSRCVNQFSKIYGYNPLLYTQYKAASVLFDVNVPRNVDKYFVHI